ncbi:MAG: ATP-binding protein [Candidatus Natronoplasma sp.]
MPRHDQDNKESELFHLYRAKQELLGSHEPLNEIDQFEDNEKYLGCACHLHLDLIIDVKKLLKHPDKDLRDRSADDYRSKRKKLESKRRESEEERDKFSSTLFLEERDIVEEEQKTIVFLLLGKNGIGVYNPDRTLSGEEILTAVHLAHDIPVEKGRKYLLDSSALIKKDIIGSPYTKTPDLEIEKMDFGISEFAISGLLGEKDRAEKIKEQKDSDERTPSLFQSMEEGIDQSLEDDQLLEELDVDVNPEEVILPLELKGSIFATVDQLHHQEKFYEDWGMKSIVGDKHGVSLLFTGPSGTGKTMMAQAIGNYSDDQVYYLPLNNLLSSWYGKTEKNVQKVFARLNDEGAVLIIDEAEGILNKRYSSNDAAGSTENRTTDIFLKEMEKHEGVIVFTSNYSIEMDKALSRRIDLKVKFPEPDKTARKKIWKHHIPDPLPLAEDVDIEVLASKYDITGGEIKNAVLNAARKAISESKDEIHQKDFIKAIKFENDGAMSYSLNEDKERLKGYS